MEKIIVDPKSVAKVKDPLPIPTVCHYCGGVVTFESNSTVYLREYGEWPYMYICAGCKAYVGVHPNTYIPLGTLADSTTREARKLAKREFFRWRKHNRYDKTESYQSLAKLMGIPVSECHFGWFNIEQCQQAYELLKAHGLRGT